MKFIECPDCAKRGVWMRLAGSEDVWRCRYCDFYAYNSGEDESDVKNRDRLAKANPQRKIWVTDHP